MSQSAFSIPRYILGLNAEVQKLAFKGGGLGSFDKPRPVLKKNLPALKEVEPHAGNNLKGEPRKSTGA